MQKVFQAGEALFFDILIICLVSFIYFNFLPITNLTLTIGMVFAILYIGVNFYVGYKYNLKFLESLIVGLIGCSMGLFLLFFALYTQYILNSPNTALWIAMPYFSPTMSAIKMFIKEISISYVIYLMFINIAMVVMGSFSKFIINKFLQ
ncbi:hypothetical protein [Clostridium sp. CCUG 7971]|uniref:hypothetical protein n=1 Tax=Clostridium sp. CCUG 7971 TaxID=2811414 RepID=UPI001ABA795E|nr:hypothetical protein [Clostridium sp. CCUG 7971]MBO3443136.1 hypothetical protein [Clostridium sp. CCUG 7971]